MMFNDTFVDFNQWSSTRVAVDSQVDGNTHNGGMMMSVIIKCVDNLLIDELIVNRAFNRRLTVGLNNTNVHIIAKYSCNQQVCVHAYIHRFTRVYVYIKMLYVNAN